MDTLPDLETFDIFVFHSDTPNPDLDRIETALLRSEKVVTGLVTAFPKNAFFADHLATTRRALALIPEAREALAQDDRHRLDAVATALAGLFTAQDKGDKLTKWGLLPG